MRAIRLCGIGRGRGQWLPRSRPLLLQAYHTAQGWFSPGPGLCGGALTPSYGSVGRWGYERAGRVRVRDKGPGRTGQMTLMALYRVFFEEWAVGYVEVSALSESEAMEEANRLIEDEEAAVAWKDNGFEITTVEEMDS